MGPDIVFLRETRCAVRVKSFEDLRRESFWRDFLNLDMVLVLLIVRCHLAQLHLEGTVLFVK